MFNLVSDLDRLEKFRQDKERESGVRRILHRLCGRSGHSNSQDFSSVLSTTASWLTLEGRQSMVLSILTRAPQSTDGSIKLLPLWPATPMAGER